MKMEMTRPATRIELAERVDELQEKLDKKDKELETCKKIAEFLAGGLKFYSNSKMSKEELIDWARKEVEKDDN